MTIYNLHCDRCGGIKTHETTFSHKDYVNVKDHNGTDVFCRSCERGKSKADLDGPTEVWATAKVEQGVGFTIYPEHIRDDETLQEYIERRVKEDYTGRIAADIADGISESDIDSVHAPVRKLTNDE